MYLFITDGRKEKNDVSNDCATHNEQKNQEISTSNTLSHHSSTPIDQSTPIAGTNRTPYRNIGYRNENCMCKIFIDIMFDVQHFHKNKINILSR